MDEYVICIFMLSCQTLLPLLALPSCLHSAAFSDCCGCFAARVWSYCNCGMCGQVCENRLMLAAWLVVCWCLEHAHSLSTLRVKGISTAKRTPCELEAAGHANHALSHVMHSLFVPGPGFSVMCLCFPVCSLMSQLGYSRYIAQGGDWGAIICRALAM